MSGAAEATIWHDVECGGYSADLPLWDELADSAGPGPVLELGCGTGRVALHLARRGHRVVGLDRDSELVEALRQRAGELPVRAVAADARDFDLGEEVALSGGLEVVALLILGVKPKKLGKFSVLADPLQLPFLFASEVVPVGENRVGGSAHGQCSFGLVVYGAGVVDVLDDVAGVVGALDVVLDAAGPAFPADPVGEACVTTGRVTSGHR